MQSRQKPLRQLAAATLALCMASLLPVKLYADAPQLRTQAPGFYRMMLGSYEITALLDGTHPFPVSTVLTHEDGASPSETVARNYYDGNKVIADRLLTASFLKAPPEGSINAFLVNTGSKLILIDSGAGSLYGSCCGKLVDNLRAAGYQPEQVDEVLITHLHEDHVGGLTSNGKMVFPHATMRVNKLDADYWLKSANEQAAPAILRPMFAADSDAFQPYIKAGQFKPFEGSQDLLPGIKPVPTPGHTPGHTSYEITSDGQSLLVWGDIVHVAAIQFPEPNVTVEYDSDPRQAVASRLAIFSRTAHSGEWVAAAHISFPGLGHIGRHEGKYIWVPANYTTDLTSQQK